MGDIFLHLEGKQAGPYSLAQVRQYLAEGRISGETLAWHPGLSEWEPVANVLVVSPVSGVAPVPPAPRVFGPSAQASATAKKEMNGCLLAAIIGGVALASLFVLSCLAGIALGPINAGIKIAKENASMQTSRAIGLAMYQYAADHNGAYPDGKTSTEVFQKLLDGKYISDAGLFYLAMPGKTKAASSTLTAENVSYDVTSGVTASSSDAVPVVFCTGYTFTYAAGASAARDPASSTPFPGPGKRFTGLAVTYKNNNARFIQADDDGTVPYFIPAGFDAGTATYRQLKP
jgi:hypothetical protein